MFEYVNTNKLTDKLLFTLINAIVFGYLYTLLPKNNFNFDNSDIHESMYYSMGMQFYRFDFKEVKKYAFVLAIFQVLIAYVVLII